MEESKTLSAAVGTFIGIILGNIFYLIPAKFLICGPLVSDQIILPDGVQSFIFLESLKYGSAAGGIIGFLGGLSTPKDLPRGEMSRRIGATSGLVCVLLAWITQHEYLGATSGWRIFITVLFSFFTLMLAIPFSDMVNFIEKARE